MISVSTSANGDPALRHAYGKIGGPYVFTARRDNLLLKTKLQTKIISVMPKKRFQTTLQ